MKKRMVRSIWHLLSLLVGGLIIVAAVAVYVRPQEAHPLSRARVPDNGLCPDVASGRGRLHVVFGRKDAVYYASSTDEGKTFSASTRAAGSKYSASMGHERGPKIALGRGGSIHLVWMGSETTKVFYARSTDGGQHFSEPQNLAPPTTGVDGASIAADETGKVYVVAPGRRGPRKPRLENADARLVE